LSTKGSQELEQRQRLGRYMMQKSGKRAGGIAGADSETYGFGKIETLPNLPNQDQARDILTTLANDPGILACMNFTSGRSDRWRTYPEGKAVNPPCVMGLNKNKGQQILLRIRTDDLHGFRKILHIRKVLYHELAHNVHSAHDGDFFQLNRIVEKECTEMDWTKGAGLSSGDAGSAGSGANNTLYTAGTYRLGGTDENTTRQTDRASVRELAARAALMRLTAEEGDQQNCGCGRSDLFLPRQPGSPSASSASSQVSHHDTDKKDEDRMDTA
jgi:hypothetical protein